MKRRYIWLGEIQISSRSEWSLAFPELDWSTDRPFSRDGEGRPWIPPTSIAGSIRAHLTGKDSDGTIVTHWMAGLVPADGNDADVTAEDEDNEDDEKHRNKFGSSRLRVVGTRFDAPPETHLVSQTSIDGFCGAAKHHSLRSSQVVGKGERLRVFLRCDGDDPSEFVELEDLLADWTPFVGSGRTVGRARSTVDSFHTTTLDLQSPEDLQRWFSWGGPTAFTNLDKTVKVIQPAAPPALKAEFIVTDPLVLGGGEVDKDQKNRRHLRKATDGSFALRGTELKGILRHRCEFILLSLGVAPDAVDDVVAVWFGDIGRRGRMVVADSKVIGSNGGDPVRTDRVHVSIDRFTGGSAKNRLYEWEVIERGKFTVSISDGDPGQPGWDEFTVLLSWVFADASDGYLGFGAATGRGYGTVRVPGNTATTPPPLTETALTQMVESARSQLVTAALEPDGPDGPDGRDGPGTESQQQHSHAEVRA